MRTTFAAFLDLNVKSFRITCKNVGAFVLRFKKELAESDSAVDSVKNSLRRIKVSEPDDRPDFVLCFHEGPCTDDNRTCTCVMKGLPCEKFCGCNLGRVCGDRVQSLSTSFCHRSFGGCSCKSVNPCGSNTCKCF